MKGTLKSKRDIERLFLKGRRSSSYLMTILACDLVCEGERAGRCAFIAGKKLGSAPFRNRCKRRMRELARELGGPWPSQDVAFIARKRLYYSSYSKLKSQMELQLKELGIA